LTRSKHGKKGRCSRKAGVDAMVHTQHDRESLSHYRRCRLFHKWDGCVCSRCGAQRFLGHHWIGCRCARCGTLAAYNVDLNHDWNGCKCRVCGCTRAVDRELHDWGPDSPCVCRRCGRRDHLYETAKIEEISEDYRTETLKCKRCGHVDWKGDYSGPSMSNWQK
jgi:hypothetical protein